MSKTITVAWREFKQTVLRPVFIIAVLGIPLLIVGVMIIAIVLTVQNKQPPLVGTIAIVDPSGEVSAAAGIEFGRDQLDRDQTEQIEEAQRRAQERFEGGPEAVPSIVDAEEPAIRIVRGVVRIDIESVSEADQATISSLTERVRNGTLIATAVIPPEVIELPDPAQRERPKFTLHVAEGVDSDHISLIERRIGQAVVRVRAARADLDPEQAMAMLRRPEAQTSRALKSGEDAREGEGTRVIKQLLPAVFMILLWVSTFTTGQHLLMSTIEEKSNRVMEVLLSAVSPLQLMAGKIIGHCGVGLLIALLYSSAFVVAMIVGASLDESLRRVLVPMDLVYLAIFFFMAYFMVASLMAAVGSAVSDIREANTLVTPVMLVMMIPWMLWMPISQAPNGSLATLFSFIPPASPFALIIRRAAEEPIPAWQMPLAIAWGYLCVVAMVWMAAKIFRVGVLMYGKPPTPIELLKWIRYS
ncbi:MAG: ABC transporter permease [Phycisphaerales bacterium]|nr:MAG: ABC transporter permease [Phycisphaerales bacterium]